MSKLTFYPWIKRGIGAFSNRRDDGTLPQGRKQMRAAVATQLSIALNNSPNAAEIATANVPLAGPADIVGFDPRSITRTWPRADVSDAEDTLFPTVEFGEADLPWRYTPAVAVAADGTASDRLRPWLVLLVLEDGAEAALLAPVVSVSGQPGLPVLVIKAGVPLPNLDFSWAWAHVQQEGEAEADLGEALRAQSEIFSSRIVSPRRLQKSKSYLVALVPAFELGRLAGLNENLRDSSLPGAQLKADVIAPAWTDATTQSGELKLPVYFHFRFQTGVFGGFKELARQLQPRTLSAAGVRSMDITTPGLPLLDSPARGTVSVEGALRPLDATIPPWAGKVSFAAEITPILNAPADALTIGGGPSKPLIAPPLYGQWHAASPRVEPAARTWFQDLNVEPQLRVPAALGTAVVQREQESLMASAWDQVGDLKQLNQEFRQAQLARAGTKTIFERDVGSTPVRQRQLALTAPVLGQVEISPGITVRGAFEASPVPRGFFDLQFVRFGSPRGRIGRRQGLPTRPVPNDTDSALDRVNRGELVPAPIPQTPTGLGTLSGATADAAPACLVGEAFSKLALLSQNDLLFWGMAIFHAGRLLGQRGRHWFTAKSTMKLGLLIVEAASSTEGIEFLRRVIVGNIGLPTTGDIQTAPPVDGFAIQEPIPADAEDRPPPAPGGSDNAEVTAFRAAVERVLSKIRALEVPGPILKSVDLSEATDRILAALDPNSTIPKVARGRLRVGPTTWNPKDPIEPILAAPEFPQPMYEPLRDASNEWIFPGLSAVPPNTVALLETNQEFVEAYMAGLNHEMARELLWREYPTDQRGTFFRQFWDVRGLIPPGMASDSVSLKDIAPMHSWQGPLGSHSPRQPAAQLVLLLSGPLVHRFPNMTVYLTKKHPSENRLLQDEELYPIFSGRLGNGAAFFGFPIDAEAVLAETRYYFVLQEPPSEPSFGATLLPEGWANSGSFPGVVTAAGFATATLQRPVRVGLAAASLLSPPTS